MTARDPHRKSIARGKRWLDNPPTPRTYKRPVTAYVHYRSMGDEIVAFALTASAQTISDLICRSEWRKRGATSDVVDHWVARKLDPGARLVVLPSQAGSTISDDMEREAA